MLQEQVRDSPDERIESVGASGRTWQPCRELLFKLPVIPNETHATLLHERRHEQRPLYLVGNGLDGNDVQLDVHVPRDATDDRANHLVAEVLLVHDRCSVPIQRRLHCNTRPFVWRCSFRQIRNDVGIAVSTKPSNDNPAFTRRCFRASAWIDYDREFVDRHVTDNGL